MIDSHDSVRCVPVRDDRLALNRLPSIGRRRKHVRRRQAQLPDHPQAVLHEAEIGRTRIVGAARELHAGRSEGRDLGVRAIVADNNACRPVTFP